MDANSASLVEAINDFEGAVVLVSHDTYLVKMVADTLWLVEKGARTPFEGDIDEYQYEAAARAQRRDRRKKARPRSRRPAGRPAAAPGLALCPARR